MSTASLRSTLASILFEPPLLALSERLPVLRRYCRGWRRTHPFDRAFGVSTSGSLTVEQLGVGAAEAEQMTRYAGCAPSVVRRTLRLLPRPEDYTLVDLGCGKGRSSIVASEFPFRRVIGVDLSERVARIAKANAAIIRARLPDRAAIDIVVGNAATYVVPAELRRRVVYFHYNSFPASLMPAFAAHVTEQLRSGTEHAFLICYNPVACEAIDASPAWTRFSAEMLAVDPSEAGYGPDAEDAVVIWQSVPEQVPARPEAGRSIRPSAFDNHVVLGE